MPRSDSGTTFDEANACLEISPAPTSKPPAS